jgi:hypothetical protein
MSYLDCGHAYAGAAAVDQQCLSLLQSTAVKYIRPHGKKRFGQGCGLNHAQARRDRQGLSLGYYTISGIASAMSQGADLVAHFPAHNISSAGHDGAGNFQPRQVGCTLGYRVKSLALQDIGAIDSGGSNPHENFSGRWCGQGTLSFMQYLRPTGPGDFYRAHLIGKVHIQSGPQ